MRLECPFFQTIKKMLNLYKKHEEVPTYHGQVLLNTLYLSYIYLFYNKNKFIELYILNNYLLLIIEW